MYQIAIDALNATKRQWNDFARAIDYFKVDPDAIAAHVGNGLPIKKLSTWNFRLSQATAKCKAAAQEIEKTLSHPPASDENVESFVNAAINALNLSKLDFWQKLFDEPKLRLGFAVKRESGKLVYPLKPRMVAATDLVERLEDLGAFIDERVRSLLEIASVCGERDNLRRMRLALESMSAYPQLTSDLAIRSSPTNYNPAGTGTGNLQRQVQMTLRSVLGRSPRLTDTRSFVAALEQSFEVVTLAGRTETRWRPHAFVGQAELGGGVTGAQASLYNAASLGLENVLPLLDRLYPLDPNADDDLISAYRGIVRSQLIEVVNELKLEGGPRVARVNGLFDALAKRSKTATSDPREMESGALLNLKTILGLSGKNINTLDEELNASNYIAIEDFVFSLKASWDSFANGTRFGKDLGTRFVLLSRSLSVAAESVDEVIAAMDSVFVGASERQVASFETNDGQVMYVDQLFSWITTFTLEEAPRLVQDGGRKGVEALIPTAVALENLVDELLAAIPSSPALPTGMRHPRVLLPLHELAGYLNQVRILAAEVKLPVRNEK